MSTARALPPALVLLLLPLFACAQDPWRSTDVSRVVAFGDVHGAYSALIDLLQATQVVGDDLSWSGGSTHLVSLGDLLDRGPDSRHVLDLLMRLEAEAVVDGGRVHVVLGNHELMNLIGDLRYVSAAEYAAFATDETPAMRAQAYSTFAAASSDVSDTASLQARFDAAYPAGYFAHRAAFSADGVYGSWLLERPAITVVNETAYTHGGLPMMLADSSLDELNSRVQSNLRQYLRLRDQLAAADVLPAIDMQQDTDIARNSLQTDADSQPLIDEFIALSEAPELSVDGPLWYRGSVYCNPTIEQPILNAALATLGVKRVVVGHTPTGDRRVRALYDGKIIMLDTGMLVDYYDGRPAGLVLEHEDTYVQYLTPLERGAIDATGSARHYGLSETQLLDALENGTVTVAEADEGDAALKITVDYNGTAINAVFYRQRDGGAGNLELAAAALDELLGSELIAPTVPRIIDGDEGALQLRYSDAVTEAQRLERQLGFAGWCPIEPQIQLMYAFDLLTANRGRSVDNINYGNDLSEVSLTDHGRAFGTARSLPAGFDPTTLDLPTPLVDGLRALDETKTNAALGDWIGKRQIRALLSRRDELVANQ